MEKRQRRIQIDVPAIGSVSFTAERIPDDRGGISLRPDNISLKSKRGYISIGQNLRKSIRKQKVVILDSYQVKLLTELAKPGQRGGIGFVKYRICPPDRKVLEEVIGGTEQKGWLRIRRFIVCECANPIGEYKLIPSNGNRVNDGSTYTVLVEYEQSVQNVEVRLREMANEQPKLLDQDNNGLVSGGDPNSKPPPPIASDAWGVESDDSQSDFTPVTQADELFYQGTFKTEKDPLVVAVVDTGLKFNLHNPAAPYTYSDHTGKERKFMLAYQDGIAGLPDSRIGYCAVARYKQNGFVEKVLTSQAAKPVTPENIALQQELFRNSPYDDHRMFAPGEKGELRNGRHGTTIGAIINQQAGVAVLPVKAFDHAGHGTLFDVLCGLNYILERHKSEKIRVLNASWIFKFDSPLLRSKIEQLNRAGILVVAAAGNVSQVTSPNLSGEHNQVYPACYSSSLPNVITVTTVGRTLLLKPLKSALSPGYTSDEDDLLKGISSADLAQKLGIKGGRYRLQEGPMIPFENYSKEYVTVGVKSFLGRFPSPFLFEETATNTMITGSSFATAIVSAKVACYLRQHPDLDSPTGDTIAALRQRIVEAISVPYSELNGVIQQGRVVDRLDSSCMDSNLA